MAKKFTWKYKLEKSITTLGIVRKLIVAAVASARYVYHYINELVILSIVVYLFHPSWLVGSNSLYLCVIMSHNSQFFE